MLDCGSTVWRWNQERGERSVQLTLPLSQVLIIYGSSSRSMYRLLTLFLYLVSYDILQHGGTSGCCRHDLA